MHTPKHPRYKRVIAASIWAVAIGAVLFGLLRPNPASGSDPGLQVGQKAPDFTLKTLDGQTVNLSDFKGRPVMINFWATWCPACREEMPDFEAAYQANKEKGLVILAINLGDAKVAIESFQQKHGLSFPIILDEHTRVTKQYKVIPLPTTYFVDAQGVIRSKQTSLIKPEQLREHLIKIMGGDFRG